MAKRRTKKQKERAKHQFTLSWKPNSKTGTAKATVKGQKKLNQNTKKQKAPKRKSAYLMEKSVNLRIIRRDILKSLILASLILSLEVVLYLFWQA